MKSVTKKLRESITNNIMLKIAAVFIAALVWLAVVNLSDPTKTITIYGIPINLTDEEAITDQNKVYKVDQRLTLNVTITGKRSVISELSSDDFTAVAPLDEISVANSVQVEVSANKKNVENKISIVNQSVKAVSVDVEDLDITKLEQVKEVLDKEKPDVIINCAAATNVDGCEKNQELAFKINAIGPRNLAMVCEEIGAKLVQVSTDYVFSGVGEKPLAEFEMTAPYSIYGKTKLAGENFVKELSSKYYIVRTAWLYGRVGKNFVYTMANLGKTKEALTVVDDQRGNPTNANDLAYHILKLIETEEYGVYHCTGNGECSWYDFASEIMKLSGRNCTVNPCTSSEYKAIYPNSADRPAYSSLDNMMLRCTVGDEMRDWKDAIKTFMDNVEK